MNAREAALERDRLARERLAQEPLLPQSYQALRLHEMVRRRDRADVTARQLEIVQLLAEGLINREIGQRLFLSEETIKTHIRNALFNADAANRAHLVAIAFRRGWIT